MKQFSAWSIIFILIMLLGCSSGSSQEHSSNPLVPPAMKQAEGPSSSTYLWGMYDITFDPVSKSAEIIPLRTAEIEVNLLKFLEGGAGQPKLTISDLVFTPPLVTCTMTLEHPFEGFPQFTGFMVRGIIVTDGSHTPSTDPDLIMSGPDELRLTNYDGYTRWLNPVEFPSDGTIFNYIDGAMGDPNGDNYTSTLNPYKLFADGLDEISDDLNLNPGQKSAFKSGSINSRRLELDFGSQAPLHFQYAVVASWEQPSSIPPQIPDDFPSGTVASEPWKVQPIELQNTLYYTVDGFGGDLTLRVVVSDFEDGDQDAVFIEAPGIFPRQEMELVSQTGGEVTFDLDVMGIVLTDAETFDVFISAVATDNDGYDGRIPGAETAMYSFHSVGVDSTVQVQDCPEFPFFDDFESYDCVWTPYGGTWWGVVNSVLDAKGGGNCYEDNDGSDIQNPNVSYVVSPQIDVPASDKDLILKFNHTIDVDPVEPLGTWAWDMCFIQVNGVQVFPTGGPAYEDCHVPWSFADIQCWTAFYDWTESEFNLGNGYNGTTIQVEFVLDTFDNINNCDPPYFGWLIEDITVEFAE